MKFALFCLLGLFTAQAAPTDGELILATFKHVSLLDEKKAQEYLEHADPKTQEAFEKIFIAAQNRVKKIIDSVPEAKDKNEDAKNINRALEPERIQLTIDASDLTINLSLGKQVTPEQASEMVRVVAMNTLLKSRFPSKAEFEMDSAYRTAHATFLEKVKQDALAENPPKEDKDSKKKEAPAPKTDKKADYVLPTSSMSLSVIPSR